MKKLVITSSRIPSYAYRDSDWEWVELADTVQEVGEGAFHRAALSYLTVGHGVKHIGADAFTGTQNLNVVWLSSVAFHSPVKRILPPLSSLKCIAAPGYEHPRAEERLPLALGYVLHSELRPLYSAQSLTWIMEALLNELPAHASELCSRGILLEILQSLDPSLLPTEALKHLISCARSAPISRTEKQLLTEIESRWGCLNTDTEKHLLRVLWQTVREQDLRAFFEHHTMPELPSTLCGTDTPAPPELLRFVFFRYMLQAENIVHKCFVPDSDADRFFSMLSRDRFLKEMGRILSSGQFQPAWCIPAARYADSQMTKLLISILDSLPPDQYALRETLTHAIPLGTNSNACLFAAQHGLLSSYAFSNGIPVEQAFLSLFDTPELPPGLLDLLRDTVRQAYISGTALPYADLCSLIVHPEILTLAKGLILCTANGITFTFDPEPSDSNGKPVFPAPDEMIRIAHPCEMAAADIFRWQASMPMDASALLGFAQFEVFESQGLSPDQFTGLIVSQARLQSLPHSYFSLQGSQQEIRILFQNQTILQAHSESEGYVLSPLLGFLTDRQYSTCIHLLNRTLYRELLLKGRISIRPYLSLLSQQERRQLLHITIGKGPENAAWILEYERSKGGGDDELNWD